MTHTSVTKKSLRRPKSGLRRTVLLYALPALLIYGFIVLVPTIQGGAYAFTNWNGLNAQYDFVGISNLKKVFADAKSTRAIINTVVIAVSFTVIQNIIGLLVALGVNSKIKTRNFLKVLIFAPVVMTPVVVGYLWQYMLGPKGPVNAFLRAIGLDNLALTWLGEPKLALGSIIFVIIWQFIGYSMVIFLAGLQGVPDELHEAAAVDGAGPIRRFFHVTLPLLGPAITINLMLSMIGALKLFDQVWALTGGGPGGTTDTLTTLLFKEAFVYGYYSKGISLGLILLVLVVIISAVQYRLLLRKEVR